MTDELQKINEHIEAAMRSGKAIVMIVRKEEDRIFLERTAIAFPVEDLTAVAALIVDDINKLRNPS